MSAHPHGAFDDESEAVLTELQARRARDAPTHGGRLLSYVYDSGSASLDALAGAAAELARPLNGLDPTTFPSIAMMESDLVRFMRRALGGEQRRPFDGGPVVGSVTSGGTESCLLAVKTARDVWRRRNPDAAGAPSRRPRIVAPETAHAAFRKAALAFDLEFDGVPCAPDGHVAAADMIARLDADVALVVVSAPAYPSSILDPVADVAAAAHRLGVSCHVDACFGGLALPWWPATPGGLQVPAWDFRVRGVTSMSADLHKFGYAPKGVSVLLHRGRARHRAQFFATTDWPGYPVVNPTLLGSRSASPLAAAWAITRRLGTAGFADLIAACARSVEAIMRNVEEIPGLSVWGAPLGPAIALVADTSCEPASQVDPHHLADELARLGFRVQHQPGFTQANGVRLPHSVHFTVTPVTEHALPELLAAMRRAADTVRGKPRPRPALAVAAMRLLGYGPGARRVPGPAAAWAILRVAGAGGTKLPGNMAPLMALVEELPAPVAEALLTELLARVSEP